MSWKPDVCIFHHPCHDGFAASVIVQRMWPDCELVPANYGDNPSLGVTDKNILIADFSFKKDAMLTWYTGLRPKSIVILDHHKTAQEELKDFHDYDYTLENLDECIAHAATVGHPPIFADFDMHRSGAMMTWNFCHPNSDPPHMLEFIQDRDLWTKVYPESDAIHLWLSSLGFDYDAWEDVIFNQGQDPTQMELIGREAKAIKRYYDQLVFEVAHAVKCTSFAGFHGVPVVYVIRQLASDAGAKLLEMWEDAPFAVMVSKSDSGHSYSLRSTDERQDVSAVAKQFGGGGHRNAAGFRAP